MASMWVRSEIVLIRPTAEEISCERSPSRLKRFSVSEIDSRKLSMPRTVADTARSAPSVADEACSATLFDSSDRRETCISCLAARCRCAAICSSASRSPLAVSSTRLACRLTDSEVSRTRSAILLTSASVLPVSCDNWLMDDDSVPMMSSVTGARAVKSLLDSWNTVCSSAITEVFSCSFSLFAFSSCAMRSSSSLSKARPSSPISSGCRS